MLIECDFVFADCVQLTRIRTKLYFRLSKELDAAAMQIIRMYVNMTEFSDLVELEYQFYVRTGYLERVPFPRHPGTFCKLDICVNVYKVADIIMEC